MTKENCTGSSRNRGVPRILRGFSGQEFVLVSGGEFLMGSAEIEGQPSEWPQHNLYLPNYYISVTPVTNAQWAVFLHATGKDTPLRWQEGKVPMGKECHPVTNISWHQAVAYCRWLSSKMGVLVRLPTEAEWEKAASWNPDKQQKRQYPWGNDFYVEKCNSSESKIKHTTPVGRYSPGGDSFYGCQDMAGNVWEWTLSLLRSYPYEADDGREDLDLEGMRVVRGGGWNAGREGARTSFRDSLAPAPYEIVGFRLCVIPVPVIDRDISTFVEMPPVSVPAPSAGPRSGISETGDHPTFSMSRKRDLELNIRKSYALIREYEEKLRLSSDPRDRARFRQEIEDLRELLCGHLEEYVRAAGDEIPGDIREIVVYFGMYKATREENHK